MGLEWSRLREDWRERGFQVEPVADRFVTVCWAFCLGKGAWGEPIKGGVGGYKAPDWQRGEGIEAAYIGMSPCKKAV